MRLITIPLSAAIIALAAAGASVLPTTSEAAKPGNQSSATPCHAYEQNPDGSWKEIGCAEDGLNAGAGKNLTRNEAKTSH